MKIEIWSDFACPFCYLGEKKMEEALKALGMSADIRYRSFQLDENATSHPGVSIHELLAKKYGTSYEQAKAANERIVAAAKEQGLIYDFENIKPSNTGLAHQLVKYAEKHGKDLVMAERLFEAYFTEGVELGILENLLNLAEEVGLDRQEVMHALGQESYKTLVQEDQKIAMEMGISSVPFFVLNGKVAISGAQEVDAFKDALIEAKQAL